MQNTIFSAVFLVFTFLCLASQFSLSQTQAEGFSVTSSEGGPFYGDIGLYDGSLNHNISLLRLAGRGGMGFSPTLRIAGGWEVEKMYDDSYQPQYIMNLAYRGTYSKGLDYRNPSVGYGPGVLIFKRESESNNYNWGTALTRLYFYGPNGGRIEFRDVLTEGKRLPRSLVTGTSRGTHFVSMDGSAMTFISDSTIFDKPYCPNNPSCAQPYPYPKGYLKFSDGNTYRIENGVVLWAKDRNGNTMHFTYYSSGQTNPDGSVMAGQIQSVTDSTGRVYNFEYDVQDVSPYGLSDRITYKGTGGAPRTIRISKRQLSNSLKSGETMPSVDCELFPDYGDFTCPPNQEGCIEVVANCSSTDPIVASAIFLPDDSQYEFKYNHFGELAMVKIPTGGIIEYDHIGFGGDDGGFYNGDSQAGENTYVYRRVSERRVYAEGNILQKREAFSADWGECTSECWNTWNQKSVVSAETYDGQTGLKLLTIKRFFYGTAWGAMARTGWDYSPWREGREYKTEVLDGDGILLKRTENDFQQRAYVSWWNAGCTWQCPPLEASPAIDPRVTEVRNTDIASAQVSKTRFAYDEFNNPTDVWEYDFGTGQAGALLRYSHTEYLRGSYINNTSASSPHIRRLPERQWISDDEYGTTKQSLTEFEYDNYNSDSGHAPLLSRSSVVNHDSSGFDTATTQRGNTTKVTKYIDAQAQTGSVSAYSQYDILGNVVKTIDQGGGVSTTSYVDNFGFPDGEAQSNSPPSQLNGLSTFSFPTSSTNALGWVVGRQQFDYFVGAVVNSEDINGIVSKMVRSDLLDRLTQTEAAIGTDFQARSTLVYDDQNRRSESKTDLNSLNDNAARTEAFYDSLGRTVETRKYASEGYIATRTEFDSFGRPKRVSNPFRPSMGEQPIWSENFYDALGRITKVRLPDNSEILTEYVGNTIITTDQAGKKRRLVKNAIDQLVRVDEPDGNGNLDQSGSPILPTFYHYDVLGNLETVNQDNQIRTYLYDGLSRLLSETSPELGTSPTSGTISFQYDAKGNLIQKTDANNITTTSVYDVLGRITSKTYSDTTPAVSYTYDDPLVPFSKGRLTRINSSVSTSEYLAFDAQGKALGYRQITDGQAYQTNYSYNLSGALIEQTYPSGRVVKNELYSDGRLKQVQSRAASENILRDYADNFIYNAAGIATSIRLGNGKYETYRFNSRMQVEQIDLGSSLGNSNLLKLEYDYGSVSNNGNLLAQKITVPSTGLSQGFVAVQSYWYDSLNRLAVSDEKPLGFSQLQCDQNPTYCWKQAFVFDRYGNRNFDIANTTTLPQNFDPAIWNPTADSNTNRLTSAQGYIYDQNGNLIQDAEGRSFSYDAENNQIEVKNQQNQVIGTYLFDGSGRRVKKVTDSETVIFVYNAEGKLIAEYSTESVQEPKINYVTADNSGTTRITTDQLGKVVARTDNLPYGENLLLGQRSQNLGYSIADSVEQGYTGYIRDEESGFDFANDRMYSNLYGRFNALDAARPDFGNPQTLNRYQYCLNNPIRYIDKTGGYEEDVHRWLTMALAYAVGFNTDQASKIGGADQWLDDNPATNPLPNDWLSPTDQKRAYNARVDYHFTTPERRDELWNSFGSYVARGENGNAFSALGTFLHAFQDSFSHAGLSAATGQAPAGTSTIPGTSIPYWWSYDQAELPDKTWHNLTTSSQMARETFDKLLEARNDMAKSGKFGSFTKPVKYEDISDLVNKWLGAKKNEDKTKIWNEIIQTITIKQRDYG